LWIRPGADTKVDNLKCASLANIRLGWNGLQGTNTLAYYCRQTFYDNGPWLKQNEQTYWPNFAETLERNDTIPNETFSIQTRSISFNFVLG
jgi:hypothetical protein